MFEPRIVCFFCKWCTYAGADMAGTTRLEYPATVRMVRFPCTGRMTIAATTPKPQSSPPAASTECLTQMCSRVDELHVVRRWACGATMVTDVFRGAGYRSWSRTKAPW